MTSDNQIFSNFNRGSFVENVDKRLDPRQDITGDSENVSPFMPKLMMERAMMVNNAMTGQSSPTKQFDVQEVQTIVATVDLDDVRSYRASIPSFGIQSSRQTKGQGFVSCDAVADSRLKVDNTWPKPSEEIALKFHLSEEECCLGMYLVHMITLFY